ncbi:hypothetical protein [Micromonospora sp. URMC 103]|uniref:hypothetical protein n=1 Tax=Micromonospora sp. URMC 103 TaxID=3423406 RepID=UPI003F1DD6E0
MIDRGSGRTSGLTDWHRMDVNSMWACLQDHDTTNHWKQVAGWRKICDLAQAHLARLQEYRRGLAEAWPPATSAAARRYLAELDELIEKVRHTHDAAATNYTTLAAATQAISGTRATLGKIHEEYAVKLQQKRAYEATAADPKAAMGSRVPDRPVTDADLEQLNVQARGIMYGLSAELQHAQVALRQPPPPSRPPKQTENPDVYGASGPPMIPPIMPLPANNLAQQGQSPKASAATQPTAPPFSRQSGPVLGGAGAGPKGSPAHASRPTTSPNNAPHVGALPTGPPLKPSRPPKMPSLDQRPPNMGSETTPGDRAAPPRTAGPAQSRPLPPGGMIGSVSGPTTNPNSADSQPRRINPVGGVIGGGSAGTAPTGGAGSRPGIGRGLGTPPFHTSPNLGPRSASGTEKRYESQRRDLDLRRTWDPNDPWKIDRGVNPIMMPPNEEGPIDPGPAIGLRR